MIPYIALQLKAVSTTLRVLMPLFWLESLLPPEAGLTPWLAPVMVLVLIALVFVLLVNVAGALVVAGHAVVGARRAASV